MQIHPEVDVVTVGTGWTAGIIGQQLAEAGLEVVSLERGRALWTYPDFAHNHDYLKYATRNEMLHDISRETLTWRPDTRSPSLPFREHGSQLLGTDLGGTGVHWTGIVWRFLPMDFRYRSHHVERYGEAKLPEGSTLADWPISYDELEPYYDEWEYAVGISGDAGNLGGTIVPGGNPFEGPRSRPFPVPALAPTAHGLLFADACHSLGYHPFINPSALLSQGYTDASGHPRAGCLYCGHCSMFGCEVDAKSSPLTTHLPMAFDTGRYEVRTHCTVTGIEVNDQGLGTGLRYIDRQGREHLQPAARVFLTGFTFTNVRLLLLSRSAAYPDGVGNGRGLVGRNYTSQLDVNPVAGVFEGRRFNPFMGNTGTRHAIFDFYGDVFDHSDLDFIGGGFLAGGGGESGPIGAMDSIPTLGGTTGIPGADQGEDEPADEVGDEEVTVRQWGQVYKDAMADAYNGSVTLNFHGEDLPYEHQFLDLDPRYTDAYGLPLLRITYDTSDNQRNMRRYMADRLAEIMRAMGPDRIAVEREQGPWTIFDGSTHPTGGAIMGTDPSNSVTNRYGQVWGAPNVFVIGAALFPQNPGGNPTETIGAMAYWTAAAIKRGYLNRPYELMT